MNEPLVTPSAISIEMPLDNQGVLFFMSHTAAALVQAANEEMKVMPGSTFTNIATAIRESPALGVMIMRACWSTYGFETGLRITYAIAERILQLEREEAAGATS